MQLGTDLKTSRLGLAFPCFSSHVGSHLTQTLALGPDPATPSSPVSCPLLVKSDLEKSSVYGLTSLSHLCHELSNPLKWCRSLAESPPFSGPMPVVVVYKGALYKEWPVLFRGAMRPRVSLHQIWQKTLLLGHRSPCHKRSALLLFTVTPFSVKSQSHSGLMSFKK